MSMSNINLKTQTSSTNFIVTDTKGDLFEAINIGAINKMKTFNNNYRKIPM